MPDVKSNIDIDLNPVIEQLESITDSVDHLFDTMSSGRDEFVNNIDFVTDATKGIKDAFKDSGKEIDTQVEHWTKRISSFSKEYEDMIAKMRKEGGLGGVMAEMAPAKFEPIGMQGGVASIKKSILSELPFGGLVGLMMLGGMREEEVRAMGARTARVFQQTGDVSSKHMQRLGSTIRELGVALGKGPTGLEGEVAAAAGAFAAAGIDIEEVLDKKFSTPIRHSRGSILETSVALDQLFKQGAGTAARQMSQMTRDFNLDAQETDTRRMF